jgi:putative transposase
MRYRRTRVPGGSWFFTVVTRDRIPVFRKPVMTALLRHALRKVRRGMPFTIDAIVVLPDHLHCIWTLPAGDADYSTRWRLIKSFVTRHGKNALDHHSASLWQHRYWEHHIRNHDDYRAHVDYIHYNPVKHGYVDRPVNWPYSSLGQYINQGVYPYDWGSGGITQSERVGRE